MMGTPTPLWSWPRPRLPRAGGSRYGVGGREGRAGRGSLFPAHCCLSVHTKALFPQVQRVIFLFASSLWGARIPKVLDSKHQTHPACATVSELRCPKRGREALASPLPHTTPRPALPRAETTQETGKLPGMQELEIRPGPGPTHPPDSFLSQMGRQGQGVNGNSCPRESEAGFNHAWRVRRLPAPAPGGTFWLLRPCPSPPLVRVGVGGLVGRQTTTVEGQPLHASLTHLPSSLLGCCPEPVTICPSTFKPRPWK